MKTFICLGILILAWWSSVCVAWIMPTPPPRVVMHHRHRHRSTTAITAQTERRGSYTITNDNNCTEDKSASSSTTGDGDDDDDCTITTTTTTTTTATTKAKQQKTSLQHLVRSVNYFISRKCNYSCQFCFHTAKTSHHLTLDQARQGLLLLAQAGTEKINFAGGEPFLHPTLLGELCRYASHELKMAVSIISNGSLITEEWMETYGRYVDVMGVSIDSFDETTNAAIGRGESTSTTTTTRKNRHVDRIMKVRELCFQHDILFKVNTVVCRLNWQEDMTHEIQRLNPHRWKIFQVLLLKDENMGRPNNLKDARSLVITHEQFQAFVSRHKSTKNIVPESNAQMQNSYLLLDEEMRFLDCSFGGKVPGASILDVGVQEALSQAGFDHEMFQRRGGVYDWKRERKEST